MTATKRNTRTAIKLTESDLRRIITDTLKTALIETIQSDDLNQLYSYLKQDADANIYKGKSLDTSHKAYNYLNPKGIVRNQWALHFTHLEAFYNIIEKGFGNGTTNLDHLAYSGNYRNTTDVDMDNVTNDGWLFALPIDNKYIGEDLGYGDCGFVILTDGVLAYHEGDRDYEIIFQNKNVKKKLPFMYDEDNDKWLLFVDNNSTPTFNNLSDLIHTATNITNI